MTTTMGQLVSEIFTAYDRELGDQELAAVATQVRLSELLTASARARRSRRIARSGK